MTNNYNFGPKNKEEEEIFAREAARVDAEVAAYQGSYRYYLDRLNHFLVNWFHCRLRSIKFLYQRITRGWDDSVIWSLDIHLAGLILPRLKRFKELNTHTYPNGLTPESWAEILDKMIYAFEFDIDEERMFGKFDEAEYEKVKEGHRLFGEYFNALWD